MKNTLSIGIIDDQYETVLGMDFLYLFEVKIDCEKNIWDMDQEVIHSFYPYGEDSGCIPAIASICGLLTKTPKEDQKLEKILA